jgi:hypothetical protein
MARGVRVRIITRGVREMLKAPDTAAEMKRRAQKVADQAKGAAPVVSGAYRASIEAETHEGPTRVTGRAIATVDYAQSVEARHRVLGRAIDAARGN